MLKRLSPIGLAIVALLAGPGFAGSATAGKNHHEKSLCERQFDDTMKHFDEVFSHA